MCIGTHCEEASLSVASIYHHHHTTRITQSDGVLLHSGLPPRPPSGREPLLTTALSAPFASHRMHGMEHGSAASMDGGLNSSANNNFSCGAHSDSDTASEPPLTGVLGQYTVYRSPSGRGVGLSALPPRAHGHDETDSYMSTRNSVAGERPSKLALMSSHKDYLLDHSVLEYDRRIGQGSYGTVYLGMYLGLLMLTSAYSTCMLFHVYTGQWNGMPVAIKTLNMTLEGDGQNTQQLIRGIRAFEKEVGRLPPTNAYNIRTHTPCCFPYSSALAFPLHSLSCFLASATPRLSCFWVLPSHPCALSWSIAATVPCTAS